MRVKRKNRVYLLNSLVRILYLTKGWGSALQKILFLNAINAVRLAMHIPIAIMTAVIYCSSSVRPVKKNMTAAAVRIVLLSTSYRLKSKEHVGQAGRMV